MTEKKRLIVIGGGAAGFFCAVNAARLNPQLEVMLAEKTQKLLSKVRISGGGRCNLAHACFDIAEMSKNYPRGGRFVKKAFHQFFTNDTITWFAERGVETKTEMDGRIFPITDSSQTIIDCILREADRTGVRIMMGAAANRVSSEEEEFKITFDDGREIVSDYLCIACGGYPKAPMFEWISSLGHSIEDPVPSLFTFNLAAAGKGGRSANSITRLMGVSVPEARVRITGTKLEQNGPLLITHWGFSGPAVLKLSAWGARELEASKWNFRIQVNWLPSYHQNSIAVAFNEYRFALKSQKIVSRNPFGLPQRLWEYFLEQSGITNEKRWSDLSMKEQQRLINVLLAGEFEIKGKTTFKEEFVTAGGIRLTEVDPNTMMSKKVEGLFFAGEVLDVDGITGGYNFQHAWTSGWIAAKTISLPATGNRKA
jgi:predicted Rossmann fold flavoprotein